MKDFTITHDFPRSEMEFDERFTKPEACYEYLFKQKWPNGFVCTKCGHQQYWLSSRNLFICTKCEHQNSLTAGTIMENTKKPITYWFKAMWWFTTRKSGVNAVNLKELLGFGSYGTAWTWLQKLRRCTIRQNREKLSVVLKSMSFSLEVSVPANVGGALKVKSLSRLQLNEMISRKDRAYSFTYCPGRLSGFVGHSFMTTSNPAQRSRQITGQVIALLIKNNTNTK